MTDMQLKVYGPVYPLVSASMLSVSAGNGIEWLPVQHRSFVTQMPMMALMSTSGTEPDLEHAEDRPSAFKLCMCARYTIHLLIVYGLAFMWQHDGIGRSTIGAIHVGRPVFKALV